MARRRRSGKRAPLTRRQIFWMRLIGSVMVVFGAAVTLFFSVELWNNLWAVLFTALILFLLSGLPIIQAARHRRVIKA